LSSIGNAYYQYVYKTDERDPILCLENE